MKKNSQIQVRLLLTYSMGKARNLFYCNFYLKKLFSVFNLNLSCIWVDDPSKDGSPLCYYGDGDGYKMTDEVDIGVGYRVRLEKTESANEPYGKEFQILTFEYYRMSKDTLRIKVKLVFPWKTHCYTLASQYKMK